MQDDWAQACLAMTMDLEAVVRALFAEGVSRVVIQDFHRTGYNLLPELIDARAMVRSGYRAGPVPGIGNPGNCDLLMLLGMHAASGTSGFLAHTLTSRLAAVLVDGKPVSEAELFTAALAPYGLRPVFFSGCPVACSQAEAVLPGIVTFAMDKKQSRNSFDVSAWRRQLGRSAAEALKASTSRVPVLTGPIQAEVVFKDISQARKIAARWMMDRRRERLIVRTADMAGLYRVLVRICYLTPILERLLPISIRLANLKGRLGLAWVRHRLKKGGQLR